MSYFEFLSSGHLCLIHHLKLFRPHVASTPSSRKSAKIQQEFSWFCQNKIFQDIKISLQINEFKKLNNFGVLSSDLSGLRSLCSLIDLSSLCNLTGLNSLYSPISSKNFLILMVWSSMASKWPIPNLLCGMDHQKSKFLLIYGTFSVRGCWGQSMLLFRKLVDETQISKPQKYTDTFRQILTSIFLSVRAILKETVQCETPCSSVNTYGL